MALRYAELTPLWELMHCTVRAGQFLQRATQEQKPSGLLREAEDLRRQATAWVRECSVKIQNTFITAIDAKVMLYLIYYLYKLSRNLLCTTQFLLSEQPLESPDLTRYLRWVSGYTQKVIQRSEQSFRAVSRGKTQRLCTVFDTSEGETLSMQACRDLSTQENIRLAAILAMLRQCENTVYDIDVFTLQQSIYE